GWGPTLTRPNGAGGRLVFAAGQPHGGWSPQRGSGMSEDVGGAPQVRVSDTAQIPEALRGAGLAVGRDVVVLVGGAGGMEEHDLRAVANVLEDAVVPVVERRGA